jgi:DNA polymerase-1
MGVGQKTARQILSVYGSIDSLENGTPPPSLKFRGRDEILRRIRANIETVRISRKLATICCDAPIEVSPQALRYRRADPHVLEPLCEELGFCGMLDDIPVVQPMLFS